MRHLGPCLTALSLSVTPGLAAQDGYPVVPQPLPDAEEIALATSAAPPEISGDADVYVAGKSGALRIRSGTNGVACMVSRDLHGGSSYPICFDREAARTVLQRELLENSLRMNGHPEEEVRRRVEAAFADGTLQRPDKPAVIYMMSPRQVLFSAPDKSGVRVGAWSPHLMIVMPHLTPDQLGLGAESMPDVLSIERPGQPDAQLIVKVPRWSDGSPVQ